MIDLDWSATWRQRHGARYHTRWSFKTLFERMAQASNGAGLLIMLLLAAVLFQLPALLNAAGVHSDAAIVGLQAQHILRGEFSWFLWGAGYQASFDALMVAAAFALTGPTPLALTLVPLFGHLLFICLMFATLRKHIGAGAATVATLALVFTPQAINSVITYAPRQWCITTVACAIWLLDGAAEGRRPWLRYFAGTVLAVLALYLDFFTIQFMPALAVFAAACCLDRSGSRRKHALATVALGGLLGLVVLALLYLQPGAGWHPRSVPSTNMLFNLQLLWEICLPWVLGAKIFVPLPIGAMLWRPSELMQALQIVGAASLVTGIILGGVALPMQHLSWPVRRLGLFGCLTSVTSIAAFIVSSAPTDGWAARYLAPIIWTAPFALAPLAATLRTRRLLALAIPYLVVAGMSGWLGHGMYLNGLLPVRHPRGIAVEEAQLGAVLRERNIQYAAADYWLAYRLTFLWNEQTVVVPLNDYQDRYPAYRHAFEQAERAAFIFHPWTPIAEPESYAAALRYTGVQYCTINVAEFTVLVVDRNQGSATCD